MPCREVGDVLQGYLDAEVEDRLAQRIAEHLEDCRRCGLEAEVYEEIKAALARKAAVLPDSSLRRLQSFATSLVEEPPGD